MDLETAQSRLDPIRTALDGTSEWWPDSPMITALQEIVDSMELLISDVAAAISDLDARVAALEPAPELEPEPPASRNLR